jgi:MFS superfamily sulfate permease-like transporter
MRDLLAGVVVGIVSLALALAFAIASGVPRPLHFTSGIAVIIFSSQLKDFFGMKTPALTVALLAAIESLLSSVVADGVRRAAIWSY